MTDRLARLADPATNPRWQAVALLLLFVFMAVDSKFSAVAVRTRSVQACERSRVDRSIVREIAAINEIRVNVYAADPARSPELRKTDRAAARRYHEDVANLTERIDPPFACQKAFPKPEFLGLKLGRSIKPRAVRPIPDHL